jgi:hypothetical protein
MGIIYSACDVRAVHTMLIVWCKESEPENSRFGHHTHRQLCSIHFAGEANGKINFNHIYFSLICCYL